MKRLAQILVIVLALSIVLVAGFAIYLFLLDGLESIINHRLSALVDGRYNLEVHVGKVTGDIYSGTILENVQVHYVDSTRRYLLADIPRITTAYAFSNLWRRNFLFEYLFLDSAEITLVHDSVDGWLLPTIPASDSTTAKAPPSFSVELLTLHGIKVRFIRDNDTLGIDDINLALALESTEGTYGISIEHLRFTSADQRLHLDAGGGKVTYGSGRLLFRDLMLHSRETHLRLDGSVTTAPPWSAAVTFDLDNVDLSEITSFVGPKLHGMVDLNGEVALEDEQLSGSVDLGGEFMIASFENMHADFRLFGKHLHLDSLYGAFLDNCALVGSGEIDFDARPNRYRLSADIRNFNLTELVDNSFHSDLNGRLEMTGESFHKKDMRLRMGVDLFDSEFHHYHFHRGSGVMEITRDSLLFVDPFRIEYFENSFDLAGVVEFKDSTNLTITADLPNLERYQGKLFIDQPAGRAQVRAEVSGRTNDPDLSGHLVSDSIWLYGFFSRDFTSEFQLDRFLNGRQGFVQVTAFDGNAYSIPFDTCYTYLSVDSEVVTIDTARLDNDYSAVTSHGLLDYDSYPMHLSLDTFVVQVYDVDFYNRRSIEVGIDSTGFAFQQAAISDGGAGIVMRGRADFDESLDLTVMALDLPAGPWLDLFDEELPFEGRLSCDIRARGSLSDPVLEASGSVDSLIYRELLLGRMTAAARYTNEKLEIDSLVILSEPGEYRADGYLHIDLSLTSEVTERFPDRPMDIEITANDSRFDLVSLVLPSVEELTGSFEADFRLSGTPNAPELEGHAFVKNARLKYFDLIGPFFTDSLGVTMHNNRILINHARAYSPDPEYPIFFDGEIIVKSLDNFHYDVQVTIPRPLEFTYELDDIEAKARADLHIKGDSPPLVTGDVELVSMRYLVNFAEPHEGSPIMAALSMKNSWDLDLNVDCPSNYWIKNEDIDAEMAGVINLLREDGAWRFIGEMEILRGRGFLFDKTLQLEPGGTVMFVGTEEHPDPELDIVGRTRVKGLSQSPLDSEDATIEDIEVCIHVTGTLDFPEPNPCEGSPLSKEDLIPLLVANYYASDSITATGHLEQSISGFFGSQISQIGGRQLRSLGVETFQIDPNYQGEFDPARARVTVGWSWSWAPGLYIYTGSELSFESVQEAGFEYRLPGVFNDVLVEGRSDEDHLWKIGLKAHWEF